METAIRSSCLSSQQLAHDYLFISHTCVLLDFPLSFFDGLFSVNGKIVRRTLNIVNATDLDYGVGRFEEGACSCSYQWSAFGTMFLMRIVWIDSQSKCCSK